MEEELLEDRKSLEALLIYETNEFRKFVKRFIQQFKSAESQEIIRGYLEQGRTDLVLEYINKNSDNFNEALLAVFLAGANWETKAIARKIIDSRFNVAFDITYYQTIAELARLQNRFIQDFNASNSRLFARISRDMLGAGTSVSEALKVIIDNYGLNIKQYEAIQSYRASLTNLSRDALQRTLRVESYDKYVRAAIDNRKPFTPTEIDRMVDGYRRRMIESRMNTIARTETKSALESGRSQAAIQADNLLSRFGFQLVKEWRSKRDEKVRYTHKHGNLDGQVIPEKETFLSPSGARLAFPGDNRAPRRETINCRCFLLRYTAPIARST